MYLGSVKFFKHLIIGVLLLAIIVPTGICIYLGIENSNKEKDIAALSEEISRLKLSGTVDYTTSEGLFELYKKADDKEDFLRLLSSYDYELYASFIKSIPAVSDNIIEASTSSATENITENTSSEAVSEELISSATTTTAFRTENKPDFTTTRSIEEQLRNDPFPDLYCTAAQNTVYVEDRDTVYLTFDDGPSQYTQSILYYLDKYNIKATFFVVPSGSEDSKNLLRQIAAAGHTIGVHSATHVYKDIYASVDDYLSDFKIAYDRIYEATGIKCELFRFPGGSKNDFNEATRDDIIAEMTRRGFVYFDWNVDSNDAGGAGWTEMYVNVLEQVADANRSVVLMHDHNNGYNTVLVLEDIIKALIEDPRGYKFGQLSSAVKPVQF